MPVTWTAIDRPYEDILYHHAELEGGKVAKLTINRPEVHNAFTPKTVQTEELRTSLVYEVRVFVKDPSDQLHLGSPTTVHLPPNGDASSSGTASNARVQQ